MLRRPKHSKIEVVVPKEEEKKTVYTLVCTPGNREAQLSFSGVVHR